MTRALAQSTWLAVPLMTLALGATVALSWFVFGGSIAFRGPLSALDESWASIYGSQSAMALGVGWAFARLVSPISTARLAGIVVAAWLGEWVVLLMGGTLLANELVPEVAWFFWLIATGGPIQPLAAIAGGLFAVRRRSSAAA